MTDNLATYSLVLVYSAMAIYLIAFIAYALDLAQRASLSVQLVKEEVAAPARVGVLASATASSGGVATAERAVPAQAPRPKRKQSRFERVAYALTILGWLLQVGGDVVRGVAAGRVPWANLYEFALTASAIVVGVFIFVQIWQDLKFLGAYITGFVLLALGLATVNFYVAVAPLPPALQSYWLVIHVFVATLGTAFFAIAAGLSVVQLLQARREANKMTSMKFMDTFPNATKLENLAYRVSIIGFVFWTFTLIAGAIWAEHAWGRYWGWDTKEVWTFIIWVIFAGYIHARATRGWRGSRSAWLAIIGFAAVVFNFTIVNVFFKGLHAYSGL